MSFQSQVYECSRETATVKISNNEWITEFPAGIQLEPGDSVRVLGSFIQEKGGGDEIEVDNDLSIMVEHSPYITAETITLHATDGTSTEQISLGQYAEPAFVVDNLGTEPMCRPETTTINPNGVNTGYELKTKAVYYFAAGPNPAVNNGDGSQEIVAYDGQKTPKYNFQDNWMNGLGDIAQTAGWNNPTLKRTRFVTEPDPSNPGQVIRYDKLDSDQFTFASIPREFYISTLCKKIIIPIFDGLRYIDPTGVTRTIQYTIDTSNGRTLPYHANDYIATYFIGGYKNINGDYTPTAGEETVPWNTQFEEVTAHDGANPFGKVRYSCGPRSLVGKVLSSEQVTIQYTTHEDINATGDTSNQGTHTINAVKMYVWDWVNPASYKTNNTNKDIPRHGARTAVKSNEDLNYAPFGQSSYLNGNVYGCNFQAVNNAAIQPGIQTNGSYQQQLEFAGITGPEPGEQLQINAPNVKIYQDTFMNNSDDSANMIGTTVNDSLCFLWSGKGSDCNPLPLAASYDSNLPAEVASSWACNVTETAGGAVKNYWALQQFLTYEKGGNFRAQCRTLDYQRWTNIGAIVRVNIANDNVEPYAAEAGKTHFLGVPYTHQPLASPQLTFTQNNRYGSIDVFGQQCARSRKLFAYGNGNGREPWFTGLSSTAARVDIAFDFSFTLPFNGNIQTAVQGNWHLGNAGNDMNITPYFQSATGDCKIDKNVSQVGHSDLLIIKKFKTELKLKAGFYNVSELATEFNDQLHYNTDNYLKNVGKFTTVGVRERAMASNPTIINGNFLMSFIPDLTYGFIPLPEKKATALGLTQNTDLITNIPTIDMGDGVTNALNLPQASNITVYTCPYNANNSAVNTYANENTCFRLIGGKIDNRKSASATTTTEFESNQTQRIMMCTRATFRTGTAETGYRGTQALTRTYCNALSYGGSAKIFVGSPNPTFSWDENLQKFYFEFLYSPIRPVQTEEDGHDTLGSGDAVPSIIVNSDGTGDLNAEYGGNYICSLTGDPITNLNSFDLIDRPDNSYFQIVNPTQLEIDNFVNLEKTFIDQIGFTNRDWNQLGIDPYIFISIKNNDGFMLRNYPDIDLSINGANPLKVRCTPMQPYNEYFVAVNSDEYQADTTPRLSNTPFYLIGSDLIMPHYHGGKGTKLPVIGICGRNYERFSYVFDLSESAITYRVEQAKTITSIHTTIYTNTYKEANNLFPNSAVIYIIQKNNYAPQAPPDIIQQYQQLLATQAKQIEQMNFQPIIQEASYPATYQMENPYIDSDEEDD